MGLFGRKKEDKKKDEKPVEESKKPVANTKKDTKKVSSTSKDLSWIVIKPRITEKASITPEKSNAYIFEVHPDANAHQIKEAINEIYKVSPIKVNIARIPSKKVSRRSRRGVKTGFKHGGKKAYIYLKKGDRIEFV